MSKVCCCCVYVVNILTNALDAESCFQAFVPILFTLDNDAICKVIGIAVSQLTTSTNTDLSLRILVSLFNLLSSTQSKVLVLQGITLSIINSIYF